MPVTQDTRLIRLTTPLGKDDLLLERVQGEEHLSRLFRFSLELLSEKPDIDYKKLLGQRAALTINLPGGQERYLSGYISRFTRHGQREGFWRYGAELVPWLWFLTRTADSRIFQDQTVPQII
ncbi:MAG: contractile injection system protein, VgrG/Pvc8 family, partial [Pseudomonadota bacterium]